MSESELAPKNISRRIREVYEKATCIFDEQRIKQALDELALEINTKLCDSDPIFICVMQGGIILLGNLLPRLNFPLELDYIHATRYGSKTHGGELIWKAEPSRDLKGRTIVIVDDILDEGLTLAKIKDYCLEKGCKEVFTVVLVDKKRPRAAGGLQKADFTGLFIDDFFVFGYGLDYDGYLRNTPGIYAVADEHK
jgi:hypoxanthine phosphoribosyltransferase